MVNESRAVFDDFFRTLCSGTKVEFPRPQNLKMPKNVQFPSKGTCFDHVFSKDNNAFVTWESQMDRIDIAEGTPVRTPFTCKFESVYNGFKAFSEV